MLASTKTADEHMAHNAWVGHDGSRLDAHGGWDVKFRRDIRIRGKGCDFGAFHSKFLCLCPLGYQPQRCATQAYKIVHFFRFYAIGTSTTTIMCYSESSKS